MDFFARMSAVAFSVLLFVSAAFAQPDAGDRSGGAELRRQQIAELRTRAQVAKVAARAMAAKQGWPVRYERGGVTFEFMAADENRVYTLATTNRNAAISIGANLIRETPPYNLSGLGVRFGIWDGGGVRYSHQELAGRVTIMDAAGFGSHATHVAGTIGAQGVVPGALGMAPRVTIDSYEWNYDLAEMASRGMSYPGEPGTIQISNHSYGYVAGWVDDVTPLWYGTWGAGYRESDYFGIYDSTVEQWDAVCYNAPYYLPFVSAGNDRNDAAPPPGTFFYYYDGGGWGSKAYDPETDPYSDGWDNGGFDTISVIGNAKNIVTVGAVSDAVSGSTRDLAAASILEFSAWGPSDDGRIKPDIMGNGADLYSCTADSDSSYATYSGTSMSSPNVAGSAALLLEYYGNLFPGQFMRASTLKALILHTADDLDNPGPDYRTGWGLMNVAAAADLLRAHRDIPSLNKIVEAQLDASHPVRTYPLTRGNNGPIRVTLCWTDPPHPGLVGLDNPTLCLVNDLDLRVIAPGGAQVYFPYVLDPAAPAAPATTGDNVRDNVEQVYIAEPPVSGTYSVQVSHKGSLTYGEQYFSLIVSGQSVPSAGHVQFDKAAYRCTDVAAMRLTDGDLQGTGTHNVSVMTAGGDFETVALSETPPNSGVFTGTIGTSSDTIVGNDGTLQVVHGEILTLRYEDADDGSGVPAVAEATSLADCVAPIVANVAVTDIGANHATVRFDTDEPASAGVRWGDSCGNLNQVTGASALQTSHAITLTGLMSATTYYFAIDVTDATGNATTDDSAGKCFSFVSDIHPDYFTEAFTANDNDLKNLTLTFVPDGSSDYYRACQEAAAVLPTDPTGGSPLFLGDDDYAYVSLSGQNAVSLYGMSYSGFYVGSNGYITFTSGDTKYDPSLATHFNRPRVSALFTDLNPAAGGAVSWKELADRIAVTYDRVPEFSVSNASTFQIELFFDGQIHITYLAIGAKNAVVGLSAGNGLPADFLESNLNGYPICAAPPLPAPDFDGDGDVDSQDFNFFSMCFNGPNRVLPLQECRSADRDSDGDVDLLDFAAFQACFNGPNRGPRSGCTSEGP